MKFFLSEITIILLPYLILSRPLRIEWNNRLESILKSRNSFTNMSCSFLRQFPCLVQCRSDLSRKNKYLQVNWKWTDAFKRKSAVSKQCRRSWEHNTVVIQPDSNKGICVCSDRCSRQKTLYGSVTVAQTNPLMALSYFGLFGPWLLCDLNWLPFQDFTLCKSFSLNCSLNSFRCQKQREIDLEMIKIRKKSLWTC